MNNAILGEIFLKVASFPSMPAAGVKMTALLKSSEPPIAEIEEVLRHDPGLTANVLKLANSSYFGIPSKVGSLKQAVLLLGVRRLTQLVIASCVGTVMDKEVAGYDLPPGDLWRHSVAVSVAAEALVKGKKIAEADNVFTPALLHDLGKLVLGRFVKEKFEAIEHIARQGVPFVVAENMVLGTDHAEIGAQILHQWSFPQDVVNAVRWHHNPERVQNANNEIDVVYLADLLCRAHENGGAGVAQPIDPSPVVMQRLGIKNEEIELISGKVAGCIDKLPESLSLN